jgi:plasmid stabilization system protein ParE
VIIRWSEDAVSDLERLHRFLAPVAPAAAARTIKLLRASVDGLRRFPRLGPPLAGFPGREVRRLFIACYEIRYEIRDNVIFILNLWHQREDRG